MPSSFLGVSGVVEDPPISSCSAKISDERRAARGRLAKRAADRSCASGQPVTYVQDSVGWRFPITSRLSPAARFAAALILPLALSVLVLPRPDAPPPPQLAPT